MIRRARFAAAATAVLLLVLAWASASEPVGIWHSPRERAVDVRERRAETADTAVAVTVAAEEAPEEAEGKTSTILQTILLVILLVAIVAAALTMRHVFALKWTRERRERELVALPDVADTVTAGAQDQLAALASGMPRNAIVACWVRLEEDVAAAGLAPDAAETSAELTARVLSRYRVAPAAIDELSALYREARFSVHELGEEHRDRAVRALRLLHDDLARHAVAQRMPSGAGVP